MKRLVYFFGNGQADGTREMKAVLGGKGANLAEMTNLGVPVPPGFTIACEVCVRYLQSGTYPAELRDEIAENVDRLERATGKRFGDPANPLLVSVRSGAPVSMPGMMETILNLGLNDVTVEGLAQQSGNARFAYDSYRRLLQMYGDVVLGVSIHDFESLLKSKRLLEGVTSDSELSDGTLRNLVEEYKALIRTRTGNAFPMDPIEQLWVIAVLELGDDHRPHGGGPAPMPPGGSRRRPRRRSPGVGVERRRQQGLDVIAAEAGHHVAAAHQVLAAMRPRLVANTSAWWKTMPCHDSAPMPTRRAGQKIIFTACQLVTHPMKARSPGTVSSRYSQSGMVETPPTVPPARSAPCAAAHCARAHVRARRCASTRRFTPPASSRSRCRPRASAAVRPGT